VQIKTARQHLTVHHNTQNLTYRDVITVAEKPRITEGPKDVLVQENSDVFFQCRASGEPEPTIIWKKVDDQMPQGRSVTEFVYLLL